MIVFFILFFKTAVTPQKGIENLRVAISSDGTLGDFQVKELVIHPEESTKSSTTTGIKGLVILFISLILSSRSYQLFILFFFLLPYTPIFVLSFSLNPVVPFYFVVIPLVTLVFLFSLVQCSI